MAAPFLWFDDTRTLRMAASSTVLSTIKPKDAGNT